MRKLVIRWAGVLVAVAVGATILVGAPQRATAQPAPTVAPAVAQVTTAAVAKQSAKKKKKKKSSASARKGRKALAYARKQVGDRYRWGGTGPNAWDCSGLTMKAWRHAGVKLSHYAPSQLRKEKRIKRSQLRKGDLVFFYKGVRHVGIYAGNGKVIHASRPGKPVGYAKIKSMPYVGASRPR